MKIAISGVGGGVGQSIIKCLQNRHTLVGLDGEHLAAGFHACDKCHVIPYASDPSYLNRVLGICKEEECSLLFPGLDAELPILSENKQVFQNDGINVIVSDPRVVALCDNKLLTSVFLRENGFPSPMTFLLSDERAKQLSLPFIVKPCIGGARSKGVKLINNWCETESIDNKDGYVAQEYIAGDEFTCGAIMMDGLYFGCIVMRRTLRDGDTYKCFCVRDKTVEDFVGKVVSEVKPYGVLNLQFRIRNGEPIIFEMNARCSGTTAARMFSGFNEPQMIVDYLHSNILPRFSLKETCILRYWKELVVPCHTLNKLKRVGKLDNLDVMDL